MCRPPDLSLALARGATISSAGGHDRAVGRLEDRRHARSDAPCAAASANNRDLPDFIEYPPWWMNCPDLRRSNRCEHTTPLENPQFPRAISHVLEPGAGYSSQRRIVVTLQHEVPPDRLLAFALQSSADPTNLQSDLRLEIPPTQHRINGRDSMARKAFFPLKDAALRDDVHALGGPRRRCCATRAGRPVRCRGRGPAGRDRPPARPRRRTRSG
jgi:hypothetical protein